MPRIKKYIMAVEDVITDSLRPEDFKYLNNFICYEEHAKESFEKSSRRNCWKDSKSECLTDVDKVIKDWKNPKKSFFFCKDDIAVYEVKLSAKIKATDDYIYRCREYEGASVNTDEYISYKEIFPYINKRIKSKYVLISYNGVKERVEYSDNELANIIARMANNTNTIDIAPVGRDGHEGDWLNITIFKNMLHK